MCLPHLKQVHLLHPAGYNEEEGGGELSLSPELTSHRLLQSNHCNQEDRGQFVILCSGADLLTGPLIINILYVLLDIMHNIFD